MKLRSVAGEEGSISRKEIKTDPPWSCLWFPRHIFGPASLAFFHSCSAPNSAVKWYKTTLKQAFRNKQLDTVRQPNSLHIVNQKVTLRTRSCFVFCLLPCALSYCLAVLSSMCSVPQSPDRRGEPKREIWIHLCSSVSPLELQFPYPVISFSCIVSCSSFSDT